MADKRRRCRTCYHGLRADGTCLFKCPPKPLPSRRHAPAGVRPRHEKMLTQEEARQGYERVDPNYSRERAQGAMRARRGWNRR